MWGAATANIIFTNGCYPVDLEVVLRRSGSNYYFTTYHFYGGFTGAATEKNALSSVI